MISRIPLRITSARLFSRSLRDPTKAVKFVAGALVASVWIQIIRQLPVWHMYNYAVMSYPKMSLF